MIKLTLRLIALLAGVQALAASAEEATQPYYQDEYTLVGPRNFVTDSQPLNADGTLNVVIERPTGSVQLWHLDAKSGTIIWVQDKGKTQHVPYLGYPGNYGFVPRTLFSAVHGGDDAPLDAIVLGPAVPRGEVVKVKLIGMLNLLTDHKQDHKLIGVVAGTPLYVVNDIAELQTQFPGVDTILETWFVNHGGRDRSVKQSFGDAASARALVATANRAFEQ